MKVSMGEHKTKDLPALTPSQVVAIVGREFPELEPVYAEELASGLNCHAFVINKQWVFRFPIHATAAAELAQELAVLPLLEPHLPLPIPDYRYTGTPSAEFPWLYAGYPKLPGTPALELRDLHIDIARLGAELGHFLDTLHGLPVTDLMRAGLRLRPTGYHQPRVLWQRARHQLSTLTPHLPASLLPRCARLLEASRLPAAWPLPPRLVHADLSMEHILLSRTELTDAFEITGVIDWGATNLGDPAVDFTGLYHWMGEPLVRAALVTYSLSLADEEEFLDRVRFYTLCTGLHELGFGLHTGRAEHIELALLALQRL